MITVYLKAKILLTNTPVGYIMHGVEVVKIKECCYHKTKKRSEEEYKKLVNRLNRIEGQVRGVKSMIDNDAYCTDILVQISAIQAALNSFNKELLSEHIKTCVVNDIKADKEETVDELLVTIQKLMK